MITIVLNGSKKQVENNISVSQLLAELGLSEKRLAVEINQHRRLGESEIVPGFQTHQGGDVENLLDRLGHRPGQR